MELKKLDDVSGKMKSFWDRREGTTGYIMLGGAILFVIWLLDKYSDRLAHITDNVFNISMTLLSLGAIAWVLTNKRVQRVAELAMYWLTGIFIEMNPLLVMNEYLDSLEDDRQEMDKHINSLSQQKGVVDGNIQDNNERIKSILSDLQAAKQQADAGNEDAIAEMQSIQLEVGLLQTQNDKYVVLSKDVSNSLMFLEKMFKSVGYFIRDERMRVKMNQKEYDVVTATSNALESAKRAFMGDPDKKIQFERAMEIQRDEMFKKVGQMKRTLVTAKTFVTSIDIQNQKYDNKAAELLKKLETQGYAAFLSDPNAKETIDINAQVISSSRPLEPMLRTQALPDANTGKRNHLLED